MGQTSGSNDVTSSRGRGPRPRALVSQNREVFASLRRQCRTIAEFRGKIHSRHDDPTVVRVQLDNLQSHDPGKPISRVSSTNKNAISQATCKYYIFEGIYLKKINVCLLQVIMSPKFLLRHPMAVSDLDDCGPDTSFEPLIGDTMQKGSEVKKILLCSGKVYYELVNEREKRGLADKIAIVRIEQLSPFPYRYLMEEVERYPESQVRLYIVKKKTIVFILLLFLK